MIYEQTRSAFYTASTFTYHATMMARRASNVYMQLEDSPLHAVGVSLRVGGMRSKFSYLGT